MNRFTPTILTYFTLFGCLLTANASLAVTLLADETAVKTEDNESSQAEERQPILLEKVTITFEGKDVLQQENIHEWAGKAAKLVTESYPIFDKLLESKDYQPPKEVSIVFRKMDGVAFSTGTSIVISADWVKQRPDDFGMVAHELVHVIQRYPRRSGPSWVTEGIADYIRHVHFEPEALMRPTNPDRDKYTDQYQITAGFFMWIAKTYDKEIITKLNIAMRERTYSDDIFESITGKKLDLLWEEYVEFLKKMGDRPRLRPSELFK